MNQSIRANALEINSQRRRFIRTTCGGIVLAATASNMTGCASAIYAPSAASDPWRVDADEKPILMWGLSHGILAPNPHNLQPWLVTFSQPHEMLVAIDPARLLPETDPYSRQIMIGTGAMLALFELAIETKGYSMKTEWIAEATESKAIAELKGEPCLKVTVTKRDNKDIDIGNKALFDQIRHRRTVKGNYDLAKPPTFDFATALDSYRAKEQTLGLIRREGDKVNFEKIAKDVKEAMVIEMSTPATSLESLRLLRVGAKEINKHRDGISIESRFLYLITKLGLFDRSKPMEPGTSAFKAELGRFFDGVDSTPAWLYLTSKGNAPMDQIEVGRSFAKVQLKATEQGMVMHPVSQGLQEYKEMSTIYKEMSETINQLAKAPNHTVQMLARVGYQPVNAEKIEPSPRRGVSAHLVSV